MFILNLGDVMNIKIKKWGNSQGIILPKLVLDSLGFGVDDDLILEDLIRDGYHGEDLLMEFKRIKNNFPEARESLRKDLLKEYEAGDMLDYEEAFND